MSKTAVAKSTIRKCSAAPSWDRSASHYWERRDDKSNQAYCDRCKYECVTCPVCRPTGLHIGRQQGCGFCLENGVIRKTKAKAFTEASEQAAAVMMRRIDEWVRDARGQLETNGIDRDLQAKFIGAFESAISLFADECFLGSDL